MNILTRTVIALTDEEQQTLKNAAKIYNGYNIRCMACDLENFVEDNSEIICEEKEEA